MLLCRISIITAELRIPAAKAFVCITLSSSSSLSIGISDKLNGETLAGKSAHRKVKQINTVRGY